MKGIFSKTIICFVLCIMIFGSFYQLAKAIETLSVDDEYTLTITGESATYRGNSATQVMQVIISDSSGITGSSASIHRTVGSSSWSVIQNSNRKSSLSSTTQVEWVASVTFHHAVYTDYSCQLSASYKYSS